MRRVSVRHREPTLRDLYRTVQLTLREKRTALARPRL